MLASSTSRSRDRAHAARLLVAYLAALAVSIAAVMRRQASVVGFSGADEPAHFLNAYFIHRWLAGDFGLHPLAAAVDFYVHYPKLAIGHWPPLHYAVVAAAFQVVPATPPFAMAISVVLSTLPALFVAGVVGRLVGWVAAVAACVWYAVLPIVVDAQSYFMTDQAVTAWACGATVAWVAYAARPSLARALLFAALAVAAILTKGSGWLLGLVPPLHIALTGRWRLLRDWRPYASAAAALVVLVPWYAVTARITGDSWAFEPGLDYALAAIVANATVIASSLGPLGVALAGFELACAARERSQAARRWDWCAACAAMIVAVLVLHAVVPASLESRFMAPAMPAAAALAALGLARVYSLLPAQWPISARAPVLLLAAGLLAWPATRQLLAAPLKVDLRAAEAAEAIAHAGRTASAGIWVVDGNSGAEGALIAEVAVRDAGRTTYVARASQLLGRSDWNGRGYRSLVQDESETLEVLRALGASGVVTIHRPGIVPQPHSALLRQALCAPDSGYRLAQRLEHRHRPGHTELWVAVRPPQPDLARLRAANFPAKAQALTATRVTVR